MNEKEFNNVFKLSLRQDNLIFCEKIFDANQFNPFTRYSIDIRDILPKAITKLQKILSKRNYITILDAGNLNNNITNSEILTYDLLEQNEKFINSFPEEYRNELRYNPKPIIQQIDDKIIKGVEFKIGLYINDNPIVERLFYVDGFNPTSKLSLDVLYAVIDITDQIEEKIKKNDVKNIWDDYDLINYRGLTINQIRGFTLFEREEKLRKLNCN